MGAALRDSAIVYSGGDFPFKNDAMVVQSVFKKADI